MSPRHNAAIPSPDPTQLNSTGQKVASYSGFLSERAQNFTTDRKLATLLSS